MTGTCLHTLSRGTEITKTSASSSCTPSQHWETAVRASFSQQCHIWGACHVGKAVLRHRLPFAASRWAHKISLQGGSLRVLEGLDARGGQVQAAQQGSGQGSHNTRGAQAGHLAGGSQPPRPPDTAAPSDIQAQPPSGRALPANPCPPARGFT